MGDLKHGDRVRIDGYGGEHASRNDLLYNGATGTVDLEDDPGMHYVHIVLERPITMTTGEVRSDVLCDRSELTVI